MFTAFALATLVAADVIFGLAAQPSVACQVVDGATVRTDLAASPVLTGVLTGSVGTAEVLVPWDVVTRQMGDRSPATGELALSARDGLVVARSSVRSRAVEVSIMLEVTRNGRVELSPVGLNIDGRDVSPSAAQLFAGDVGLLQRTRFSGPASGYHVVAATAADAGLVLDVEVPLASIASKPDGRSCSDEPR